MGRRIAVLCGRYPISALPRLIVVVGPCSSSNRRAWRSRSSRSREMGGRSDGAADCGFMRPLSDLGVAALDRRGGAVLVVEQEGLAIAIEPFARDGRAKRWCGGLRFHAAVIRSRRCRA